LLKDFEALPKPLEVAGLALFGGLRMERGVFEPCALVVKLTLDILDEFVEIGSHSDSACPFN
jgi:hypothetical protein